MYHYILCFGKHWVFKMVTLINKCSFLWWTTCIIEFRQLVMATRSTKVLSTQLLVPRCAYWATLECSNPAKRAQLIKKSLWHYPSWTQDMETEDLEKKISEGTSMSVQSPFSIKIVKRKESMETLCIDFHKYGPHTSVLGSIMCFVRHGALEQLDCHWTKKTENHFAVKALFYRDILLLYF